MGQDGRQDNAPAALTARASSSQGRRARVEGTSLSKAECGIEQFIEPLGGGFAGDAVYKVLARQIYAGWKYQRSEPCEDISKVPVDAQVVMLHGAHRDDPDRLAPKRFHRQPIEQVLQ